MDGMAYQYKGGGGGLKKFKWGVLNIVYINLKCV